MFDKYGIVMTLGMVLFWMAVAAGVLYMVGVCLKFDRERLKAVKELLKTLIGASLIFFLVGWLTQ